MIKGDKYISANQLENSLINFLYEHREELSVEETMQVVLDAINVLAKHCGEEPPKQGIWCMKGTAYACSVCGGGSPAPVFKYCRECGAKMNLDKILVEG